MIEETQAFRESALTGRLDFLNTGAGVAKVNVYGGTRPASVDDVPGTFVLVAIDLDNPAGVVSAGELTLTPVDAALVTNSGTATWARVTNRNDATAFDMDVGVECVLSSTTLYAGGQVTLVSAVLT